MLRLVVMIAAALWFAVAAGLFLWEPASWPMLAMAAVLLLGTVYERFHYRGVDPGAGLAGFQPTSERFRDEETGAMITVWFNPATGERRYIEAGGNG